jgi:hypothetical protein
MKKMKKIKILDNKSNIGNYTFLNDDNLLPQQSSLSNSYPKEESVDEGQTAIKKIDEKYKKKKVMNKEEIAKSSKGLKFLNQSQRNHSSVYE